MLEALPGTYLGEKARESLAALSPWAVTCKQVLLLQLDEGTASKAGGPLTLNWEGLAALD